MHKKETSYIVPGFKPEHTRQVFYVRILTTRRVIRVAAVDVDPKLRR